MTLQENRVSIASQKEQLTEDMPKLSLNYKKVETEEKRLPATRKVSIVEQAKAYILPSLLLILGVALLLFPVKKKTLGRTRSSSRRKGVVVFRIAGIVCVLASLFMMIWEIISISSNPMDSLSVRRWLVLMVFVPSRHDLYSVVMLESSDQLY